MDIDVQIIQAHRRIEVSRGELVDAIALHDKEEGIDLCEAQARHDKNVKHLRELMDEKFPETVGEW